MYKKVQKELAVKYYSEGNWLTHELTNGPIPVAPRMGRILLCLSSHRPPANADRHLKIIDDTDNISRRHVVPKTPTRQRIATAPETPSTLINKMKIVDVDQMVKEGALFEIEKGDDGESFWINSTPSQISVTPSPKKQEGTDISPAWWIRNPPSPKKYATWPEMTEDMDNFMVPLQEHLIAADALRKAQDQHGSWVTASKFYDLWWKYRVCRRKGLVSTYYGEPFKKAAKEITQQDIEDEKKRLV